MFRVTRDTIIATITDLRRKTADVLEHADEGEDVVIQKDGKPRGVYLSYGRYQHMLGRLEELENLELAALAVPRKEAVDRGESQTIPLNEVLARYAPDLLEETATG